METPPTTSPSKIRPAMADRTPAQTRDRLAWWAVLLTSEVERLQREHDVPMGWAADLARELSDVNALLRERETVGSTCAWCGEPLTQPARGRRRKYCAAPKRCRNKAAGLR